MRSPITFNYWLEIISLKHPVLVLLIANKLKRFVTYVGFFSAFAFTMCSFYDKSMDFPV